jgi:hypothetical protein
MGLQVVRAGEGELMEVILALGASAGLAGGLDGGKEQGDQDTDDGDDDEQFDDGESGSVACVHDEFLDVTGWFTSP